MNCLHLLDFFEGWHWQTVRMEVHNEVRQPFLKRFKSEDNSLEPIARMMLNLETLHVMDESGYDYIEPEKMKYFARFFRGLQHCENLSELNLSADFEDYANYTPNIKKLAVKGNCNFGLEFMDWIAKLKKVEILKLEMYLFLILTLDSFVSIIKVLCQFLHSLSSELVLSAELAQYLLFRSS